MEQAVEAFAKLPGIGKKTALRLVLHLMKQPAEDVYRFNEAIARLKTHLHYCPNCHNLSDTEGALCGLCTAPRRDHSVVCAVESLRDLIAIESTHQFNGEYHILGGVISPIEGIGPEQLFLEDLITKANSGKYTELILALNPTIEGDTTIFYLTKKITNPALRVTSIARGISFGGELEYTDELTLARSLAMRRPYENYLPETE